MTRRRSPEPAVRAAALGAVLAVLACGPPAPGPRLEFEYDGCLAVVSGSAGPVCVLAAETPDLRLWARSAPGVAIEVTAGDRSWVSSGAEPVQGGYLFRLEGLDAGELVVRAAGSRRTLPLVREARPSYGELSREELTARLLAGVEDTELGFLLEALVWEEWEEGGSRTVRHLVKAAGVQRRHGRVSEEIHLLTVLHFYLYFVADEPEEAAEVLARLPPPLEGDGRSAFLAAFCRGSWAIRTGRFAAALHDLKAARRQAGRLAMEEVLSAEQDLAHLLSRLGRYAEAREVLAGLRRAAAAGAASGCDLAKLLNDVGWSELLMLEAGLDVDPLPALRRARAAADDCGEEERWNVEVNLALAGLAQGRLDATREHLEAARALDPGVWWSRLWQLGTEARLALAEGRHAVAQELFEALGQATETGFDAGTEWRAAVGRAGALEAQGKVEDALSAYAEAEDLAFEASLAIPFDASGRGSADLYQRETRHYLALLLQLGRLEDALKVARRSLARNLRRLAVGTRLQELEPAEKNRWDVLVQRYWSLTAQIHGSIREGESAAADRARTLRGERELLEQKATRSFDEALDLLDARGLVAAAGPPPRRPGELLLLYHPFGPGWVAFAADGDGVTSAVLGAAGEAEDAQALSARWLAPFARQVRRAKKIRILPYGRLWEVDFHALPFDGAPLLARAEVVYGLDLPPVGERGGVRSSRRALLARERRGDLPHAAEEVTAVERLLRRREPPWEVRIESGVEAVRQGLETAPELFHFAGHGDLVGWEGTSGLVFERRFGEPVRLTIRDILTLVAAPASVVLSACESVRPVALGEPSSLGVGHAFLLAGSDAVVGASESVDDAEAAALTELFYERYEGPGSEAAALRAVQLDPRASPEWMKFRVLER